MPKNISRRVFVGKLATVAGAMAVNRSTAECTFLEEQQSAKASSGEILDVAIVGGGISGIYCGWRLLLSDPGQLRILGRPISNGRRLRVKVFEGSRRVGGRLLSARPPGMSTLCELGGMRFVSAQRRVVGLVNELKLPYHRLYAFDPD